MTNLANYSRLEILQNLNFYFQVRECQLFFNFLENMIYQAVSQSSHKEVTILPFIKLVAQNWLIDGMIIDNHLFWVVGVQVIIQP